MTENLLQKLEEKIINLLSEMETLRGELKQLKHENNSLKIERASSTDKLKNLLTQLDSLISPSPLWEKTDCEYHSETIPA